MEGLLSAKARERRIKSTKKILTGFEFGKHRLIIPDCLNKYYNMIGMPLITILTTILPMLCTMILYANQIQGGTVKLSQTQNHFISCHLAQSFQQVWSQVHELIL